MTYTSHPEPLFAFFFGTAFSWIALCVLREYLLPKRASLSVGILFVFACVIGGIASLAVDGHIDNQEVGGYDYGEVADAVELNPKLQPMVAAALADRRLTNGEYDRIYDAWLNDATRGMLEDGRRKALAAVETKSDATAAAAAK